MIVIALAVAYLLLCAAIGLTRRARPSSPLLAASLAFVMVCAQFLYMLTQ